VSVLRRPSCASMALTIAFWGLVCVTFLLLGLAVWYQFSGLRRWLTLALLGCSGAALLLLQQREHNRLAWLGLALVTVAAWAWWVSIKPSNDREWAIDVAHGVTAEIDGDRLILHNVRNFDWRSETDFTPHWETRIYSLDALKSVDLISSVWSNPAIAHTLISFGFDDGRFLVFSAEIRRKKGEAFSEIGGFFKKFELVLIAADERDILRLRTNIRRETVSLYRLDLTARQHRALLLSFLDMGNALAREPQFYQTVTTNCTTVIFKLARLIEPGTPLDWRILLSGYLPDYLYDHGIIEHDLPLTTVRREAVISERGQAAGTAPDFSARIRAAVP